MNETWIINEREIKIVSRSSLLPASIIKTGYYIWLLMRYFRRHIRIAPSHNILKQPFAMSQKQAIFAQFFENINLNNRYIEEYVDCKRDQRFIQEFL